MVFKECKPATLSSLCRTSLRYLALALPILYREIKLDGLKAMKLFCSRVSVPPILPPSTRLGTALTLTLSQSASKTSPDQFVSLAW